jgi:hypothetical protein
MSAMISNAISASEKNVKPIMNALRMCKCCPLNSLKVLINHRPASYKGCHSLIRGTVELHLKQFYVLFNWSVFFFESIFPHSQFLISGSIKISSRARRGRWGGVFPAG